MDQAQHLELEGQLEDRLRADLGRLPVRPYAYYRTRATRGDGLVTRGCSLMRAVVVLAMVLLIAVAAAFVLRDLRNPTPAATPTPAAAATSAAPSPSATPSAAVVATVAPAQTPVQPATITGRLAYPSDFVPPLTIYVINFEDRNVWYSTSTPRFGNPLSSTPPGPTWPPSGPGTYSISVPPGTYYVIAYRDDVSPLSNAPDAYTLYAAKCASSDPAVPSPPPGPCPYDHRLAPIAVTPGQTVSHIDLVDWLFTGGTYPPRPTPR